MHEPKRIDWLNHGPTREHAFLCEVWQAKQIGIVIDKITGEVLKDRRHNADTDAVTEGGSRDRGDSEESEERTAGVQVPGN